MYLGEPPYTNMINITVACGLDIKEKIKQAVNPKFYWSGKFWVAVVQTRKMYDKAFNVCSTLPEVPAYKLTMSIVYECLCLVKSTLMCLKTTMVCVC